MTVAEIKDFVKEKIIYYGADKFFHMVKSDFKQLESMLNELNNENWISVNDEQKPKDRQKILITVDIQNIKNHKRIATEGTYWVNKKGEHWSHGIHQVIGTKYKVIAWKPFPKPYERKESDKQWQEK